MQKDSQRTWLYLEMSQMILILFDEDLRIDITTTGNLLDHAQKHDPRATHVDSGLYVMAGRIQIGRFVTK